MKHIHDGDCLIQPDRLREKRPVAVELPAGGAMWFSSMLPHQTPPNRSPNPRRALQFHYRALSTREVDQAEYDRLFVQMKMLEDGPEKQALIDKLVHIAQEDAPWTMGFFPYASAAVQQWCSHAGTPAVPVRSFV